MRIGVEIDHLRHGFHNNRDIHQKRILLDVYEIIIGSFSHMGNAVGSTPKPFHLRKTGDTRFHRVTIEKVIKNRVPVCTFIYRVGPWANKAHIASQHIKYLWKLIEIQQTK